MNVDLKFFSFGCYIERITYLPSLKGKNESSLGIKTKMKARPTCDHVSMLGTCVVPVAQINEDDR